ncbi:hypothetical protein [Mycobacteroides sp. LB1]|uniref:hypothetical protein n=1 Tax=Mycobacteroides sp. LB1 TaxID=2750814 RepID=UPI0015DFCD39|nr:hypothetical protein [Mycobacteroides sp. LB1]
MSRVGIARNVLIACAVLLSAELGRSVQDLALASRMAGDPQAVHWSGWSTALSTVLAVAPLLLIARLSNYLRPSSFLTVAAGLSLTSTLGALLPVSMAPTGLLYAGSDTALALATVASLIVIVQEVNAPRGVVIGLWAAMTPCAYGVMVAAADVVPFDLWSLVICGVLVLTLLVFLASILGPSIEPVSTFEQFDLPGAALWMIGISGVIYFLAIRASSPSAMAAAGVGLVALAGLMLWIRQVHAQGFVPRALISRRGLVVGFVGALALGIVIALSAMQSMSVDWIMANGGSTNTPLLALWITAAAFAPVTGRLLDRGAGWVVPICGAIELIAGLVIFKALAQPATDLAQSREMHSLWTLVPGLALFGAGLGTVTVWVLYVAFRGVSRSMLATAAGLMVTALYAGRVLGGFVEKVISGEAEGVGELVRTSAVPIVIAILGLGALTVVPVITRRWEAQRAAQDLEDDLVDEQETDRY